MTMAWYYVDGSERVGPIDEEKLVDLYHSTQLNDESYIWRKGFDNWKKLKDVSELQDSLAAMNDSSDQTDPFMGLPPVAEVAPSTPSFSWDQAAEHDPIFSLKIGADRGASESEYGPFSIDQLKRAVAEKRINEKTYIFTPGMEQWIFLGDTPLYQKITGDLPPTIKESERRTNNRRPFVAKLLFHNNQQVFEGVCRDISIGGLQLLVSDCPVKVGEVINLNVHPDNSNYNFVAQGKVVRVLEGGRGFSLRFENMSEEAMSSISKYIQQN